MKREEKYINKIVNKILNETLEEKASQVVNKIKSKVKEEMEEGEWTEIDMSEGAEVCSECGGMMYEGECSECGMHPQTETRHETGKFGKFDYVETDEEVEEGNAFSGALAKAKEKGDDTFVVDGKKYKVKESKNTLQLTEDELIDVIEKLVKEEISKDLKVKDNIRKTAKPRGLSTYEKAVKGSKSENDEYLKSVTKKMKEYLKDGSKGDYDMNPKMFPKGNGELAKMDKKAYTATKPVEEYVDNFTAAGLENLDYDEIHPDENWVKDNVVGSSRTGNNPEWANTGESDVNKKRNEIREKNMLAKLKRKAYNKAPQPVVNDKDSETAGDKIMKQLESVDEKKEKLIKEEFKKMTHLINYNKKTQ